MGDGFDDVDLDLEGENRLIGKDGQVVDGKLTKDRKIVFVGLAVLAILLCSWTAQWIAFAMPYWRGDQYQTAGLFQICGTNDYVYKNVTRPNAESITDVELAPGPTHPFQCQTIAEYIEGFKKAVCVEPYRERSYCQDSSKGEVLEQILVSRYFEV
ncbi:UNVERIFIED_CONTAM: hypothetical protein HDU68_012754 [Siphonaria sp. JEL0065]|nr:hypothetical protein HDU68_012754 [Siphonaria sp. JEL0065]